jgi:hypothetical protein
MMRIKDVNPNFVKLYLFPFSLRGKAKEWFLSLASGTITSWETCCNMFMSKFCHLRRRRNFALTLHALGNHEPIAPAWEKMKKSLRNYANNGMEEWLILHLFYRSLNHMSKSTLETAIGGTFYGKGD